MLYLDTSVVVTALTLEPETSRLQKWLGEQPAGSLLISYWGVAEFSSALSLKLRIGDITPEDRATALAAFGDLCVTSLTILPVATEHFTNAANFCDNQSTGLRAADALHLAVAAGNEAILCTRDRRLQSAGLALGFQTRLL